MPAIADGVGCGRKTVRRWLHRFNRCCGLEVWRISMARGVNGGSLRRSGQDHRLGQNAASGPSDGSGRRVSGGGRVGAAGVDA
ncbi:hypothetical protein [Streptomyces noursei]|uniref:hypothetical protein n=1 Tax=Streptomyces noursei TaxID=1971 RepID=UPI0035E3CEC3